MNRTFLCVSAVALLLAGTANAGTDKNGRDMNGRDMNGRDMNGRDMNGVTMTGTTLEGSKLVTWLNGVKKSGTQLIGAHLRVNNDSSTYDVYVDTAGTLPSPNTDVWAYTVSGEYWANSCNHYGYTQGVRLDAQCSNVEGAVCERDSYCCTTRWDSTCVSEFWEEHDAASASGEGWNYYWHRHDEESICGQDGDEDGYWRSYRPLRRGIFLGGKWDTREGVPGGGAKLTGSVTFGCLPSPNRLGGGAIAKCVTNGYKPWKSFTHDKLHQACVRMYRADFCGDGVSWTENGHDIDLYDSYSPAIQTSSTSWTGEATWESSGAKYIGPNAKTRTTDSAATGGRSLESYRTWKRATYGASYCSGLFTSTIGGCVDYSNTGSCTQTYTKIP